jgi:hypothetical protein
MTKLSQPEKLLEGLTHGLRLANARNLQIPGAEQALTRLLASSSEPVQRAAWEGITVFRARCTDISSQSGRFECRFVSRKADAGDSRALRGAF